MTTTTGNQSDTSLCLKYEIVTPGSLIKGKAETYLNSPERQLELVKTLNDSLNVLFGALISRFENQGLSSLGSGISTPVTGGFGSNGVVDVLGNNISGGNNSNTNGGSFDLTQDLGNTYINAIDDGNWNANTNTPQLLSGIGTNGHYYKVTVAGNTSISPSVSYWSIGDKAFFDGTEWKKGVPQYVINKKGVIQIEQDYINSINKAKTVLLTILPSIGKLDYCIPGPNPSWHNLSQESIASYIETLNSDATQFNQSLTNYENLVNQTYGISSPMQDENSGNTDYLQMSPAGLSITKDIGIYTDNVTTGQDEYNNQLANSNADMIKLNTLKDQVNLIISAAQARRHTKRIQDGLPPVSNLCTATEKVTYISNGVLK